MDSGYVLAFDTANERIAIGVGVISSCGCTQGMRTATEENADIAAQHDQSRSVKFIGSVEVEAHRSSNTQLLPRIEKLLNELGVERSDLRCICVGRGPGSFTGVRIAMATAKGIASSLRLPLVGVSSLDAVAWNAWESGERGKLLVVADAMRKEIYPAEYMLTDQGVLRTTPDKVVKEDVFVEHLRESQSTESDSQLNIAGDALRKYVDDFSALGNILDESLWSPMGRGLLLAFQSAWIDGTVDPFDRVKHDPGLLLPVYTRLSDAEESERVRLAADEPRNLHTGVQDSRATMHSTSHVGELLGVSEIAFTPLDVAHVDDVASMEASLMGTDAWNVSLVADELPRKDRTWWRAVGKGGKTVGYAGGLMVDGDLQILKVAVLPEMRRQGVAMGLMTRIAEDARNLAVNTASLEVRVGNPGAIAFYEKIGFGRVGVRPRYYSDGEDALIMKASIDRLIKALQDTEKARRSDKEPDHAGSLDVTSGGHREELQSAHPLILAIESSCDETAAAVIDGNGSILSNIVSSQVDFHARFGGVVPEIASRKHIEAICGVCDEALLGAGNIRYEDLDAVAVTYAPGLVGALVVGVAFAKGVSWAMDIPFIGVNHLEGHLYANKLACAEYSGDVALSEFKPPAVVSLVSGGNTMLVHMRGWGEYEVLGATIDDAVGEAFDKVAKALGLPYPGGPHISRLAADGNPDAIPFPRAMMHSGDMNFSLSGLKTAVINYINNQRAAGCELNMPDICASFEQAVIDVQVSKAKKALLDTAAPTFCLGGGVAANPELREAYERMCEDLGVRLVMPPLSACGDNAAMIALVALDRYNQGKFFSLDSDAYAHADLSVPY